MLRSWLYFVVFIAWSVAIASWFPMAIIENAAFLRPLRPTAQYTEPMEIKGVVHYFTPHEKREDQLAHLGFAGGLIVFFAMWVVRFVWDRRDKTKTFRRIDILD